jgi:hypothetical protein
MGLFRRNKINPGQPYWTGKVSKPQERPTDGWRFTLKGSPRHYDDVKLIIESDPGATVYFGEALTYERGAGVALWRVNATSFTWLPKLYDWWAEMERIEPITFTFHLYFASDLRYPVLDLRRHPPEAVERYIKEHAPKSQAEAEALARRQ